MNLDPKHLRVSRDPGDDVHLHLREVLGEGSCGTVWDGWEQALQRDVAVKVAIEGSPAAAELLRLEAYAAGSLEHPNVVPIHALAEGPDGRPVLVMEHAKGVEWGTLIADARHPAWETHDGHTVARNDYVPNRLGGHLRILLRVCAAIEDAHQHGILHRDLKPENIVVGELGRVLVLDWGIAVSLRPEGEPHGPLPSVARADSAGTPAYMPPEVVLGHNDDVGPWSDVYQLGAILHEVLTGEPPHGLGGGFSVLARIARNERAEGYPADAPPALVAICERAIAFDPAERYQSASHLRAAVADYLRRRDRLALLQEADSGLKKLSRLVAEPEASYPEIVAVHAQCRLAYQQVLQAEPDNDVAAWGLVQSSAEMVRSALARQDYQLAEILLADLGDQPEFEAQLQALRDGRRRDAEVLKTLEKERADASLKRSWRARRLILVAVALVGGAAQFVAGWAQDAGLYRATFLEHQVLMAGLFGLYGLILWRLRRRLLAPGATRKLVGALGVLLGATAFHIATAETMGLSFPQALTLQNLWIATVICGLGFTADRRLLWPGSAVLLVFAGSVIWPGYETYAMGLGIAVGASWTALIWTERKVPSESQQAGYKPM